MKKQSYIIVLLVLICSSKLNAQHQEYYPDSDTTVQKKLEEWQDLKFGLMMHWGPYSQWGIEASWSICPEDLGWITGSRKKTAPPDYNDYVKEYENLKTTFNPVKFDPEKWAKAAKEAGMKYFVFTAKHHDGFCMFDSKYTDYKITDKDCPFSTNPRSNVTKELFSAFRKENFLIGAYFSKPDWHSGYYWWKQFPASDRNCNYSIQKHPGQWKKFTDYTHNQVKELVSDYGKLDLIWFDGGWVKKTTDDEVKKYLVETREGSRWQRNAQNQDIDMPGLVKEARAIQPGLIIVDRGGPAGYENYLTPEQQIPETALAYPWETCMTMGDNWSYVPNDLYKPTNEIIEKLVDVVSKGGNYLLNIGPGPDGELKPEAYQRLKEIGEWVKINGEAIYATRMFSDFREGESVRFTRSKDGKIKYIFLFDFPTDKLSLTKLAFTRNTKLQLLGSSAKISWSQKVSAVEINIPAALKKASNHVWVLRMED